ncbi:MAG: Dna2/Cas4 domain-containing protein [Planctomycetota bacterium]|nr:Dna2/Cas4 domain-containing protein [Planctomycetota bacterium]
MLNEYAYCPRLFHLMHVQGRWADNAFTVEGRNVHRRVDQLDHILPDASAPPAEAPLTDAAGGEGDRPESVAPVGDEPPAVSRSIPLGSDTLGLTGKLDLVSTADDQAVPVETKRGRVPDNEQRCWEPERVQLMAQGLLLREHGYQCDHGVLYFAGSRTRVDVPFTPELEARTLELIAQARQATGNPNMPPPLDANSFCAAASPCPPRPSTCSARKASPSYT